MQLRSQQDLSSISNKRKQISSELRSNRRDQQLSKNRVGGGVIFEEDIPLEQLLPRLQTEPNNTVNIIMSIRNHLNVSQFQDVNMLFAYIPHFFSLLSQSDRLAYETLILLTNLACEESTIPHLTHNDHSYIIQLIKHQIPEIRRQTVWYLCNLLSGGEEILYWLSSLLLIETCCSAIKMYNNDNKLITYMGYLLINLARHTTPDDGSKKTDNILFQNVGINTNSELSPNPIIFTEKAMSNHNPFDISVGLFCELVPRLEESSHVAWAVSYFSQNHNHLKRMIQMVPTLINRMSNLLVSNRQNSREAAVLFCINISQEKPKYAEKLCSAPNFFQNLHSIFAIGDCGCISDLCFITSNLVCLDKKVSYLLLNSNVFQAATNKVHRLNVGNTEGLESVLTEYGWLIVNMMNTSPEKELKLMCTYETFSLLGYCMDCSVNDFMVKAANCIQRILNTFKNEGFIEDIIKWFEESKLIERLYKLTYCDDLEVTDAVNTTLFMFDTLVKSIQ
ncbi:Importin alpha [Entamoeba marina]